MTAEQLAGFRAKGLLLDPKYNLLVTPQQHLDAVEKLKLPKLEIKYLNSKNTYLGIKITFSILSSNLLNKNVKVILKENTDYGKILTSVNFKMTQNNFSSFLNIDNDFFNHWLLSEINVNKSFILEVFCKKLTANTIPFIIGSENYYISSKKDLTVYDVKYIVKYLRENTSYEAINPATKKKEKFPLTNLPYLDASKIFHQNHKTGKYKNEIVSNNSFENFTAQLNSIFNKYEINNLNRKCHFLAQIFTETEYFTKTIEGDNSNTNGYDPWRGRGVIHLTHDYNYKPYNDFKIKNDNLNVDFVNNYSLISTNLEYAVDAGGWYWKFGSVYDDINKIADSKTVKEVTKAVQGESGALEEREKTYELLIKIFK